MQLLTNAANEHTLMAGATFVHPVNGNVYLCSNEKERGPRQNLVVYRLRMNGAIEIIKRYIGGEDSVSQITFGTCVIRPDGAMVVAMSLTPKTGSPTGSGFAPVFDVVPNIDTPYSLAPVSTAPSTVTGLAMLPLIEALPNGGKPYTSNADVGVVGQRDELYYVRMNKHTAVTKQLIELMAALKQVIEALR